ncbi:hypothetical protein J6590_006920 [Homalodisca vitripennis]|nr:hypothetical protein J6590_006920 [Homalodisca vitripennis]
MIVYEAKEAKTKEVKCETKDVGLTAASLWTCFVLNGCVCEAKEAKFETKDRVELNVMGQSRQFDRWT